MNKISALLLAALIGLLLAGCQDSGADKASCPLSELPYPRPEPVYEGKLKRDFSHFDALLKAYTPELSAAREALLKGRTIPQIQRLLESGELTSVGLLAYYLERIQRYDVDKLNAVLELNPDALEIARALDRERADNAVRSPMHGIPVLLKDNIATGDQLHTAAGAAAMLAWDPERDAFLVTQLRKAGAVILGKANLSEWANYMDSCMPNGFSANGGQTQNPYGAFETYGSSSGSAVAVAADLTTVSVGSETQGSMILPAGINSVVALKTSRGLVSGDYIIPLLPWQDVPGPMGRSVTDVAVLLGAMTGVDPNDPDAGRSANLAGRDFTLSLGSKRQKPLRVGIPVWNNESIEAWFDKQGISDKKQHAAFRKVFEELNRSLRSTGEIISSAGLTVVEVPGSALPQQQDVAPALEFGFKDAINSFLENLGDAVPVASLQEIIAFNNKELKNRAPYGQNHLQSSQNTVLTAEEYAAIQEHNQQAARSAIDQLLSKFNIDVIVSDVSQSYAPAGYPALTVPAGYAADGKPQGIVFVGGYLAEPLLLAAGYAYEQATRLRKAPNLEATMKLIHAMDDSPP